MFELPAASLPAPASNRLEAILSWRIILFAWIILFQVLVITYLPSLRSPFIYDDLPNIVYNEDFRSDTPVADILKSHSTSMQFDKRPVGGLLSWLNYRFTGLNVSAFRAVNLLIHWLGAGAAGLLTVLIARKAMSPAPRLLAMVVAAVWALHPIHSTAVIYISQRMESLMSLFFMLSCACLLLGAEHAGGRKRWSLLCALSALLCLFSKETGAGLPLILLLLDRLFVSGSWRELWRARRTFYGLLILAWAGSLIWISRGARLLEVSAIPVLSSPWGYFKTECHIVFHYFQLLIWPSPLVFAPIPRVAETLNDWVPCFLALLGGFCTVAWLARKRPWIWIPWLTILIVLAPTSSFVPVPLEPAFDYRMYLPAVAVIALAAAALWSLAGSSRRSLIVTGWILGGILVALGLVTRQRAQDYGRPGSIWMDTVMKEPENVKAWVNLAAAYYQTDHVEEARQALNALNSVNRAFNLPWVDAESAHISALLFEKEEKWPEAEEAYRRAAVLAPEQADFSTGLARSLFRQDKPEEALQVLETVPSTAAGDPSLLLCKAQILQALGRTEEARLAALPAQRLRAPDPRLRAALESWSKLSAGSPAAPPAIGPPPATGAK